MLRIDEKEEEEEVQEERKWKCSKQNEGTMASLKGKTDGCCEHLAMREGVDALLFSILSSH